jgi:hypothetical protein
MKRFFLSIIVCLFFIDLQANAQSLATMKRRLNECRRNSNQLKVENANLHSYQKQLILVVSNIRDSLNTELASNKNLALYIQRVTADNKVVKDENIKNYETIQKLSNNLASSESYASKMAYENEILKDNTITRIYDVSLDAVKAKYIERLGDKDSGFQYDDNEENTYKITKSFDGTAEAWWVFDKTIDVLMEMSIKLQPHKFDKNRTIASISTNLLEKTRFSNKPFTPQTDIDKIELYQRKAIRLLEDNLKFSK